MRRREIFLLFVMLGMWMGTAFSQEKVVGGPVVYETSWRFGDHVRGILYTNGMFYVVRPDRVLVLTSAGKKIKEFGRANFFHYIAYLNGKFYVTDRSG